MNLLQESVDELSSARIRSSSTSFIHRSLSGIGSAMTMTFSVATCEPAIRRARSLRDGLVDIATTTRRPLLSAVVLSGLIASSSLARPPQVGPPQVSTPYVKDQTTTPGTQQNGNSNISGTSLVGKLGINTSPGFLSLIEVHANSANPVAAIKAFNINSSGIGVWGESDGPAGYGLVGQENSLTGLTYGVGGQSNSSSGTGVYGRAPSPTGTTWGLYGSAYSPDGSGAYGISHASTRGYGVYGENTNGDPNGYAIYGIGNFAVTGTKAFQIDHPLDPKNAVLNHYCTEGPEPINAYRGHVVLDANGEAWVTLPSYFEVLNKDYEYQLTTIGGFAPVYVAQEIENNKFLVAGGREGMKVSWRVDAVRNDLWMQRNGAPVEVQKSADQRGKFLVPELYGQPPEMGIHFHPEH